MPDKARAQCEDEGLLTYRGRSWRVTSEPEVVDVAGEEQLLEVWVKKRGEDIGQRE